MDALELLDELEDIIDKGVTVPFTGRCLLDKDELMELIQEIKLKLPDDLNQAKWLKNERQNILNDAKNESDKIIKEANDRLISMIDENEITKGAKEQAKAIMDKAMSDAKATKDASFQYTDTLLENVENVVTGAIQELEQCIAIVKNNRNDLR